MEANNGHVIRRSFRKVFPGHLIHHRLRKRKQGLCLIRARMEGNSAEGCQSCCLGSLDVRL